MTRQTRFSHAEQIPNMAKYRWGISEDTTYYPFDISGVHYGGRHSAEELALS